MTQPLALLLYEKLLPGTQLKNRLQDMGWRVHTLHEGSALTPAAEEHKPVIILVDMASNAESVSEGISQLRGNSSTTHIPIIAFGGDEISQAAATNAGANLVVSDAAVLQHLGQFIDQALSDF